MKRSVREIGVERLNPKLQTVNVVFTTVDNAFDLLQYVVLYIDSVCLPQAEIKRLLSQNHLKLASFVD